MFDSSLRIEPSADGSQTVHHRGFNEYYHSRFGALTQANTVYLGGTATDQHPAPRVLEIGFGVGLNFRATLAACIERRVFLHYVAWEQAPVAAALLRTLTSHPLTHHASWLAIVDAWQGKGFCYANHEVEFHLVVADICTATHLGGPYSAVYLDPFSPKTNPAPWQPECLQRYADVLAPQGRLATYCAAGAIRRGLSACGLHVAKMHGLPGKREFLCATKIVP